MAVFVVRLMQAGIAVLLLVGLVWRNASVVVNAALALAVTFLPAFLARDHGLTLPPGLVLWLTGALFLHALGMAGPYHDIAWWDHLTHTLSATLVAGVGYATTRAIDAHSDAIYLPRRFMFVFVLLVTLALGVAWEVLEFVARSAARAIGQEPVLVQYGLADTILDLVFDAVGALLVALFGTDLLSDLVDALGRRLTD